MLTNDQKMSARGIPSSIIAFTLWLLTAVLALWEIFVIREMALRFYIHFLPIGIGQRAASGGAAVLGTWIFLPLVILFIAVAIGGAEYHYRRVGQPRSWQVLGWTLAAEWSILVLAIFI
jgi:hypothetical protein